MEDLLSFFPTYFTKSNETRKVKKLYSRMLKLKLKKKNLLKVLEHISGGHLEFNQLYIAISATYHCKKLDTSINNLEDLLTLQKKQTVGEFLASLSFCKWSFKKFQRNHSQTNNLIREIWCVYSKKSNQFAKRFASSEALQLLVQEIKDLISKTNIDKEKEICKQTLKTIKNIAEHHSDIKKLQEYKINDIFESLLEFNIPEVTAIIVQTIPHILEIIDVTGLSSDGANVIQQALTITREILKSQNHTEYEFSLEQMIEALNLLCKNDVLKKAFIRNNILDLIKDIFEQGSDSELNAAAKVLLELTYLDEIKVKLKKNSEFLNIFERILKEKKGEKFEPLISVATKVSYILKSEEKKSESATTQGHVMISYCHKDKDVVHKVFHSLKNHRFNVWIDLERMHLNNSNMLGKMAKAVEDSHVVLICMSEAYNESEYCQFEASYALDLGKPMIFLKVQENFKPENWLGIMSAKKFHHYVTDKSSFDEAIETLVSSIEHAYEGEFNSTFVTQHRETNKKQINAETPNLLRSTVNITCAQIICHSTKK